MGRVKRWKYEYITIAMQLGYSKSVVDRIRKAETEIDVQHILVDARREKCEKEP